MTFIELNGQPVETGSMADCFRQGLCSAEALNWAWLCGDDVLSTGTESDMILSGMAFADIEEPGSQNALALRSALRAGPLETLQFMKSKGNLKGLAGGKLARGGHRMLQGRPSSAVSFISH